MKGDNEIATQVIGSVAELTLEVKRQVQRLKNLKYSNGLERSMMASREREKMYRLSELNQNLQSAKDVLLTPEALNLREDIAALKRQLRDMEQRFSYLLNGNEIE